MEQLRKKNLRGGYGVQTTLDLMELLKTHMLDSINNKHVLVIGSILPWIEAILLHLGAEKITTLEYAPQRNDHPNIQLVTPEELRKAVLEGSAPKFDALVTFSSLEHSGLGQNFYSAQTFNSKLIELLHSKATVLI